MLSNFRTWALDDSPHSRGQAAWGRRYRIWMALRANPLAMFGLAIIVFFVILSLVAPMVAPYDPAAQDLSNRLGPVSYTHLDVYKRQRLRAMQRWC